MHQEKCVILGWLEVEVLLNMIQPLLQLYMCPTHIVLHTCSSLLSSSKLAISLAPDSLAASALACSSCACRSAAAACASYCATRLLRSSRLARASSAARAATAVSSAKRRRSATISAMNASRSCVRKDACHTCQKEMGTVLASQNTGIHILH